MIISLRIINLFLLNVSLIIYLITFSIPFATTTADDSVYKLSDNQNSYQPQSRLIKPLSQPHHDRLRILISILMNLIMKNNDDLSLVDNIVNKANRSNNKTNSHNSTDKGFYNPLNMAGAGTNTVLPGVPSQYLWFTQVNNFTAEDWDFIRWLTNSTIDYQQPPRTKLYCDNILRDVAEEYSRKYHGYISIVICVFGTLANIANAAVLTRKDMAGAPINRVLTGLAFADMLVMIEYIPFSLYHSIIFQNTKDFSYFGAVFIIFHMNFSNVLHTISVCLTIALAVWRYIAIGYPHLNHTLCSDRRCTKAIAISYLLPVVLCIPYYFTFNITSKNIIENNENVTLYVVDLSELARRNQDSLYLASCWLYTAIFKLLPCIILTVISIYLIRALCLTKKRKQALRNNYGLTAQDAKAALELVIEKRKSNKSERRADRTTRMLVAVLLLFLITELPQGILGLFSVILGKEFFVECYNSFGDMMDLLALLNGAINFILYCSMSRQFRTTFSNMFKPRISWKNFGPPTTTIQTSVLNTFV